jgi:hypothetical protein
MMGNLPQGYEMAEVKKRIKAVKQKDTVEIELEPDAWPRFERLIKAAAKAGPQHRKTKPALKRAARKKKTPAT